MVKPKAKGAESLEDVGFEFDGEQKGKVVPTQNMQIPGRGRHS